MTGTERARILNWLNRTSVNQNGMGNNQHECEPGMSWYQSGLRIGLETGAGKGIVLAGWCWLAVLGWLVQGGRFGVADSQLLARGQNIIA